MDTLAPSIGLPVVSRTPIIAVASVVLVFLASWVNTLDIGGTISTEKATVGLDATAMMKLLVAAAVGAVGGMGVLLSQRVRETLLSLPGILLVALSAVLVMTSAFAYAETATVSRAAALILVAYVCFIPTALSLVGLRTIAYAVLAGLTVHMLISWTLYLFVPSLGLYQEVLGGATLVSRMGGLGHPNSVGRVAALAGVVSLSILRSDLLLPRMPGARLWLLSIGVLAALTVIATWSRTSALAAMAAVGFLFADRFFSRWGLAGLAAAFSGICVLLLLLELGGASDLLAQTALSAATKSGELEELTSVTGRTEIWAESLRLIRQRMFTGWGLNSAPLLLAEFSQHTHNAVLHATFSGGIVAGALVVVLLAWNFLLGLRDPEPLVRAVSAFILVSCIFEDTILDTFPFPTTTLWLVALLYPTLRARAMSGPGDLPQQNP